MSRATQFVETPKGVCIVNPVMGEFTLCGDAFDLSSDEPGYEWTVTKSRCATCELCVAIVVDVRNVIVRRNRDKR